LIKALSTKKERQRFVKFCAVGFSGVFVNMAVFALCNEVLLTDVSTASRNLAATSAAVLFSIFTNFLLNDGWTWRDRRARGANALLQRMGRYYLVAGVAGLIQIGIQYLMAIPLGFNAHLANFVGIGAGVFINFFVNNLWTFRVPQNGARGHHESDPENGEHHIALVAKTP
jgi:dolichol-phosphate mannosyltransferase